MQPQQSNYFTCCPPFSPRPSNLPRTNLPNGGRWRGIEPTKPLADERQSRLVDRVHARPPAPLLPDEPRALEHTQVPRGRRPFVRKASSDLTRGGATTEMNRKQNLSPRWVGQSGDHRVERS